MRRFLAVLVPLMLLAACGDDDAAEAPTTTAADADGADTEETRAEADGGGEDAAVDPQPSSTATTVPADAPAGDGPGDDAGADEGLGDAVLASDLDGEGVVPDPGHASATGRFEAELVDGTLCVDMEVTGLDSAVTEAHLHSGRAGEEGPVVVDIGPPSSAGDGSSTWSDVCTGVGDDVIGELAAAPELAYVDVHTGSHPGGALRGQLGVISIFDRTLG